MSSQMSNENKRWSAKRKSALVLEIIQGKTTIAEASRQFDLTPSELESWVEPNHVMYVSNMKSKFTNYRPLTVKQCWSYVREKSWKSGWSGTRADLAFA